MTNIAKVIALGAALAASPALASSPGEHDPFSQTYTGRDPAEVRAEREREQKKASEASCSCGHERKAQEPRERSAPKA